MITTETDGRSPKTVSDSSIAAWVLNIGFLAALVVAMVCLYQSSTYLGRFLDLSTTSLDGYVKNPALTLADNGSLQTLVNAKLVVGRIALLSCGVSVGMSFGFLGFGLFMLGVKGDSDVSGKGSQFSFSAARLAPGVVVMACATILVGLCATRSTPFEMSLERPPSHTNHQQERIQQNIRDLSPLKAGKP